MRTQRTADIQAKRFGRVSNFVMFPKAPPRWHIPLSIAVGTIVGGAYGLAGTWIAGCYGLVVATALVVSLELSRRSARNAWDEWASTFLDRLPALLDELHELPTSRRLYLAGLAVGQRLLREPIPEVPGSVMGGPQRDRLLRWVSQQCSSVRPPFHRGLTESLSDPSA